MSTSRRSRPGRPTVLLTLAFLVGLVWLAGAAPTAAWWFPKAHPYHYNGRFTLDTALLSKSGLSAWAIDEYLAANTPLPSLGHDFMAAERKYGINARYLLAHAMLESGMGTSDIARYKHNLFGFDAYDRGPWQYAAKFRSYAKGIDAIAHTILDKYLKPTGRWWGGAATLRGMHYYASDRNWGKKIAAIANGLALPTLSSEGVSFGPLTEPAPFLAGAKAVIDVGVDLGSRSSLPAGLRVALRWRPESIVEADPAAVAKVPPAIARPTFVAPLAVSWRGDSAALTVAVPARAGRYALDVTVLDTDGAPLPDAAKLTIPTSQVRVFPGRGISYGVSATGAGLHIGATNLGPGPLSPSSDAVPAASREPGVASPALVAWALPLGGGAPTQLGSVGLRAGLPVGAGAAFDLGSSTVVPLLPAILVVEANGLDGGSLDTGPPAVYRLDADPSGVIDVSAVNPIDPASNALLLGRRGETVSPSVPVAVTTSGRSSLIAVRTAIAAAAAPTADAAVTTDDRTLHGTIAVDAVPVSGGTTALALRAPMAVPVKLKAGTTIGGSVQLGEDPNGPAAYLAVARTTIAHGDGTFVGQPVVFWLVTTGPPNATATSPTTKTAPAPVAKPKPKKHAKKPARPRYPIHVVQRHETLWSIGHHYGVSVDFLRRLNPWVTVVGIHPGDRIRV